ncbi:MAG: hypothetical protein KDD35_05675 [Bdellovibrionales bacterium]|nr:hypothetical protein [Bdellovibrionales bacterium]
MALRGVYNQNYLNLDNLIDVTTLQNLHSEMAAGIARSYIDKGVVSCGSQASETKLELCQVLRSPEKFFSTEQLSYLNQMNNLHEKAWYCCLLLPIHHPYFMVFLRRERSFWKKQYAEYCDWTANARFFPKTLKFISQLPFKEIGRILFFITDHHYETLIHYDASDEKSRGSHNNTEMLYLRSRLDKRLFLFDPSQQKKIYVNSYASFWNDLDWHGTEPAEKKTFALRVDGFFNEKFKIQLEKLSSDNLDQSELTNGTI